MSGYGDRQSLAKGERSSPRTNNTVVVRVRPLKIEAIDNITTRLTRLLAREGFLWVKPIEVTQKAISERFLTFPAILFEKVLKELLPQLRQKSHERINRPLPESIQFARSIFAEIWRVDGSTLLCLVS